MKNLITVILFTLIAFAGFSQKIKVKKNTIYVDGMEYMTYDRETNGAAFNFTFYDLSGEEIAYATGHNYYDASQVSDANRDGRVYYYEMKIEGVSDFFEMNNPFNMKKKVAKLFYKGKVINDGKVDLAKAEKLTKRRGKPHSAAIQAIADEKARQDQLELERAKSKDVIIINEEKPSLINIKL